jgi:hypothetical protein
MQPEKHRFTLLKHLQAIGPFIDGSLVTIARACGNPRCKCARGEKHRGVYLTYKPGRTHPGEPAKTQTLYVPVALEEEVRRWAKEYDKLKHLIREMSDTQKLIIRQYVAESRKQKQQRKKKS